MFSTHDRPSLERATVNTIGHIQYNCKIHCAVPCQPGDASQTHNSTQFLVLPENDVHLGSWDQQSQTF